MSAIEVTGAPSAQPERALTCFDVARSDALYTALALTPFPIWRIPARNCKEKKQGSASKASGGPRPPVPRHQAGSIQLGRRVAGRHQVHDDERHEVGRSAD
ncbi:MAG: hypothetical protein ABSE42_00530, partial [Bryobacteraceae bacterium]